MAERRMFAKTIIDSDSFLDMPVTARLLYYDLAMRADDDGFVNSPKKIMRMIGASQDDLNILVLKKFILPFDNGIVVIKHWRIHNYIRKDTYNQTPYLEEKEMLELDENKAYKFKQNSNRQLSVDDTSTQVRLGKDSIGKVNKYNGQPKLTEYTQEYLDLYNPYPKHVGKKTGYKKYLVLLKKHSHGDIQSGVEAYYLHKLDENHGEIGDLKFWKDFDTLLNQIENWIPEGDEK